MFFCSFIAPALCIKQTYSFIDCLDETRSNIRFIHSQIRRISSRWHDGSLLVSLAFLKFRERFKLHSQVLCSSAGYYWIDNLSKTVKITFLFGLFGRCHSQSICSFNFSSAPRVWMDGCACKSVGTLKYKFHVIYHGCCHFNYDDLHFSVAFWPVIAFRACVNIFHVDRIKP